VEYKDYYKVLGVSKDAPESEIKRAFRKLARQYHPDLNPGNRSAEDRFKEINEAYEVLSDAGKRKKYDELGSNWEQIQRDREYARQYASPGFEGSAKDFDLGDFFSTFFGEHMSRFGGDAFGTEPVRGDDLQFEIELTLEDVYHGTRKLLNLSVGDVCPTCKGQGLVMRSSYSHGRKQVITSGQPCGTCHGTGRVTARREVKVKIPRGIKEGSKIRLSGMGDKGIRGGPSGDLYLMVKILPHRLFQAKGYDLEAELPVWADEAALGAQIEVPTLDQKVRLKVPPGSQTGHRLRLSGKGLHKSQAEKPGDLYYRIKIVVPTEMSDREQDLYGELRRLRIDRGVDTIIRKQLG